LKFIYTYTYLYIESLVQGAAEELRSNQDVLDNLKEVYMGIYMDVCMHIRICTYVFMYLYTTHSFHMCMYVCIYS
jgi:hypothetical protein